MATGGSGKQSDINKVENKNDLYKDTLEEQIPFEQALTLAGIGRYSYGLLVFTVFSLLASCTEVFSVGVIAVSSQCDLDLDVYKRGLVSAVPMLGFVASAHIWGFLADTRGRKLALMICMAGTAIVGIVTGFINDWVSLTVLKFLGAFFGSGTMYVIWTILGESIPESHRRCFLLISSTGLMFSQGINLLLAYPTLRLSFKYYLPLLEFFYRPWRLLTQIFALTNVINFLLLWLCIYDSPKFHISKGNHDKGLDILRKIYKINTGNNVQSYSVKRVILEEGVVTTQENKSFLRSVWDQTAPLFYRKHIKNSFLICYICVIAYSITPPFSIWFPEIFNKYSKNEDPNIGFCQLFVETPSANRSNVEVVCDDSIADSTYILIVSFASYLTIMSAIILVIITYLGKKWTYIMVHVLSAIFALLINFLPINWGILTFILMMTNVTCMGITTAYAVEMFPTYMRAMAVCLTIMAGRALSFVFTRNIGIQLLTNCSATLYFFAAFIMSGAIVALFLPSDKENENKSDIENNTKSNDNCDTHI